MHIFSAVSAAVLLIAGFIILAHLSPKVFADTEGAYTFTINSGEATIDEYDADIGGVNPVIPNSLGGVPVVAVGNNAFEGKNLESVSLPSMLETIGDLAFAGNSLESITFPSGLESIGQLAFVANQLEAVVLPNSVTTVSSQAFMQNSITSVTLSTSMTVVDEMVFSGNSITSFTIPSHITEIKQYAFAENLMTSIAIPSTLQTLEGFAFNDSPITNVQVGTSGSNQNILLKSFSLSDLPIETIEFNGDNVTLESYTLSSIGSSPSIDVSFNEGTLVLGNYAFDNPAAAIVRSIVISPNVTSLQIGNYAFRNASLLESFAVPDGVPTTIGEYAFNSAGIKQLHIGDSVTSIGESAFDNTPLETLDIKEGIETIGQWAFGWSSGGAGTSPVLESVVIPNSVTTLGQFPLGYRTVRSLSIGTPDFTGTPLISISPASFSDSGIEELT
ncbi:MAG TPA: leucine-rich repeat domain-containing protein, partial [Candidatus Saccharibacteria bacterium]|nr:leucine-rich repeat domain-containing protein [Candidatus Saccharibacteria bacterium]